MVAYMAIVGTYCDEATKGSSWYIWAIDYHNSIIERYRYQEWLRGDSRSIHFRLVVKIDYTYSLPSGLP
jgi:hypothetical protein